MVLKKFKDGARGNSSIDEGGVEVCLGVNRKKWARAREPGIKGWVLQRDDAL